MRWKSRIIAIGWFVVVAWNVRIVNAQVAWVSAGVVDYRTNQPLSGSWHWTDSTGHVLAEAFAETGGFSGYVPLRVRLVRVDVPGYRPVQLPVHWPETPADSLRFRVVLPAIPIDKPDANQPYFQSEQKPFRLTPETPVRRSVSAHIQLLDVLTNRPVPAEVYLFFTQSHQKTRYPATEAIYLQVSQPDIIALEVRAPGYQPYLGNLIVDNLFTKRAFTYTVRLSPIPIVLMAAASRRGAVISNVTLGAIGTIKPLTTIEATHSWATIPGKYQLSGRLPTGQIQIDTIFLKRGVNGYIADRKPPPCDVLYFAQSSYEISASARGQLNRLLMKMRQEPSRTLQIIGHTDSAGNPHLNLTLSEFRAKVTRTYLIQRGIQPERIQFNAVGDQQPAFPNDSESNRSRNRRVDMCLN